MISEGIDCHAAHPHPASKESIFLDSYIVGVYWTQGALALILLIRNVYIILQDNTMAMIP